MTTHFAAIPPDLTDPPDQERAFPMASFPLSCIRGRFVLAAVAIFLGCATFNSPVLAQGIPLQVFFENFDAASGGGTGTTHPTGIPTGPTPFPTTVTYGTGAGFKGVQTVSANLNAADSRFSGNYLHLSSGLSASYPSDFNAPGSMSILIENLPEHDSVNLDFLMLIAEGHDGDENFVVRVGDGTTQSVLARLSPATSTNSAVLPANWEEPNVPIAAGAIIGQSAGYYAGAGNDIALDFVNYQEDIFSNIPHTSSSLQVEFFGFTNATSEFFALENVGISVNLPPLTPEPGAIALFAFGLGAVGIGGYIRRRRNAA